MEVKRPPLFERLKKALEDGIAHEEGRKTLRVTQVVIPEEPESLNPQQIQEIRHQLNLSQAGFAKVLLVTNKTVQSWEQGQRVPTGSAKRLLQILRTPKILDDLLVPLRKMA